LTYQGAEETVSRVAPDAFGNLRDDAFQIVNGVHGKSRPQQI
jgi:hypothetical protein